MRLLPVDTTVTVIVNTVALTDDTDFKTRETAVAYNAAGMDLVWNFETTAGVITQTAVTPTTGGVYDWSHVGDGIYKIEIPASGGGSINNDTEGYGWFSGVCDGVLPWTGPTYTFVPGNVVNSLVTGTDKLQADTVQISGDTTAADNLEAAADGTGYNLGGGSVVAASVTAGVGLADDAISSAKFDESTAFPLASADSGSTQIARTGADGDTLETLSDQIDAVPTSNPSAATIADAVWDETIADHQTAGSTGELLQDIDDEVDALTTTVVTGTPQNEVATSANLTTGTVGSGTFAATETDDGTYYQINPAAADGNGNGIDVYLEYQIGTRFPNAVTINGKFNATGNRYTEVYAYNWSTTTWDKISDINTRMNNSSSDENYAYPLTAKHRNGAGSNGEVRIRFTTTETNGAYDLDLDQVLVQSVQAAASAAEIAEAVRQRQIENTYRDGVTVDTANGTTGTDIGDYGIPQRPVDNLSDAYAIATNARLNFNTFYMTSGSSVTLDASDYTNWVFKGAPSLWTVALGGRTLTGTAISSARVSGELVNTGNRARFYDCVCFAVTLGNSVWYDSVLTANTITAQDGASISFRDCETASNQAVATVDFDSPTSATGVDFLDFHGLLEIDNMNANAELTVLGVGTVTVNASCTDGTLLLGPDVKLTNDGSVTVTRIHTKANVLQVADSDVAGVGDFKADVSALATQASIDALNDFDPANDTVARVTLVDTTTTNTDMVDISGLSTFDPTTDEVESGVTWVEHARYTGSVLAGQIADAGTGTETFKAMGNSGTTRVTFTVDASGNRSGVALS